MVVIARTPPNTDEALPGIRDVLMRNGFRSAWQLDLRETSGILTLPRQDAFTRLLAVLQPHAQDAIGMSAPQPPVDIARAHRQAWIAMESVAEVARLTFRHPNTIRYRLRKLETLTGRSLKNPADVVDLTLAARIAALPSRRSDA